jgi:hypothetical protein
VPAPESICGRRLTSYHSTHLHATIPSPSFLARPQSRGVRCRRHFMLLLRARCISSSPRGAVASRRAVFRARGLPSGINRLIERARWRMARISRRPMSERVNFEILCPNDHDQTVTFSREEFEAELKSGALVFHSIHATRTGRPPTKTLPKFASSCRRIRARNWAFCARTP